MFIIDYKKCFAKLPVLETERLILRQISDNPQEGIDALEFINDFEVYKFWGYYDIENDPEQKKLLPIETDPMSVYKNNMQNYKNMEELNWSVFCKEDGHLIGEILLFNFQAGRQAEIGYRLSRKYWNKGYITEGVKAVLRLAFEEFGFSRLNLRCHKINSASKHMAEKLGFQQEGLIRKGFLIQQFADYYIFGMLLEDYINANKKQLEKALRLF